MYSLLLLHALSFAITIGVALTYGRKKDIAHNKILLADFLAWLGLAWLGLAWHELPWGGLGWVGLGLVGMGVLG